MTNNYPVKYQSGFHTVTGENLNNHFDYLVKPTAIVATGTTQATSNPMKSSLVNVTTGTSNQGISLPPCTVPSYVNNATGATIKIYPFTAAGTIDGGSAGAAVTLTSAHRGAWFYPLPGIDLWASALIGAVSS